jgi:uncharacterized RmlC-like cupin family protein
VTRIGTAPDTLPFPVRRFFTISGVPADEVRGCHAHRSCEQVLVAVAGCLIVDTWDEYGHRRVPLATGDYIHLPAGVFATQSHFSPDAVLLVLASEEYRPDRMITADEFFAGSPQRLSFDPHQ